MCKSSLLSLFHAILRKRTTCAPIQQYQLLRFLHTAEIISEGRNYRRMRGANWKKTEFHRNHAFPEISSLPFLKSSQPNATGTTSPLNTTSPSWSLHGPGLTAAYEAGGGPRGVLARPSPERLHRSTPRRPPCCSRPRNDRYPQSSPLGCQPTRYCRQCCPILESSSAFPLFSQLSSLHRRCTEIVALG